jgi:hypothetical protein
LPMSCRINGFRRQNAPEQVLPCCEPCPRLPDCHFATYPEERPIWETNFPNQRVKKGASWTVNRLTKADRRCKGQPNQPPNRGEGHSPASLAPLDCPFVGESHGHRATPPTDAWHPMTPSGTTARIQPVSNSALDMELGPRPTRKRGRRQQTRPNNTNHYCTLPHCQMESLPVPFSPPASQRC